MKVIVNRKVVLKNKVHYPVAYMSKEQFQRPLGASSKKSSTSGTNGAVFVEPKELFQAVYLYDVWPFTQGNWELYDTFFDRYDPDNPPNVIVDPNTGEFLLDWSASLATNVATTVPYNMVTKKWIICPGGRNALGEAIPFVYTYDLILNKWHALRFPPLDKATYLASSAIVPYMPGESFVIREEPNQVYPDKPFQIRAKNIETFMLVCGSGKSETGEVNTIQMYNTRLVNTNERIASKQTALPIERYFTGYILNFSSRPILTIPYDLEFSNGSFIAVQKYSNYSNYYKTYGDPLDNKYNTVYVGGTSSSSISRIGGAGEGVYEYIFNIDVIERSIRYSWACTYGSKVTNWLTGAPSYTATDTPNFNRIAGMMDNYMIQGVLGYVRTTVNYGNGDDYDYFTFGTEDSLNGQNIENYGSPISYKVWYANTTIGRMNQQDLITRLFETRTINDPKEGPVNVPLGCCIAQDGDTSGLIIGGCKEVSPGVYKALSGVYSVVLEPPSLASPDYVWRYGSGLDPLPHPRWNASAVYIKDLKRFYTLDLYIKIVHNTDPTIWDFSTWAKEIHGYDITILSFRDWLKTMVGMSESDIDNLTDSQITALQVQWRAYQNTIADWKDAHENEFNTYKTTKTELIKTITEEYHNYTLTGVGTPHQEEKGFDRLFVIGGRNENGFVPEVDVYRFTKDGIAGEWETGKKAWKGLNEGEMESGSSYSANTTIINVGGGTTGLTREEVQAMIDSELGWKST